MYIIFDLDKTSLYCPLADKLDKFIPKFKFLKRIYYLIYPLVHILEIKLGLFKVNENMYSRALQASQMPGTSIIVLTARHKTKLSEVHIKEVFKDVIPDYVFYVAQGLTGLSKAEYLKSQIGDTEQQIIMFDDNFYELKQMKKTFKSRFTGFTVYFNGKEERIARCL